MSGLIRAELRSQERLADGIYEMRLRLPFANEVRPGQFVSLYLDEAAHLLPRPISVAEAIPEKEEIVCVYRVAGYGTGLFSGLKPGDSVDLLGPLGNGFPISEQADKKVLLLGGGIGIPPMFACAKELKHAAAVLGYRDELFLADRFSSVCETYIATEDGSAGTAGTVLDAVKANALTGDVIFACGPTPMLRAVKSYAQSLGIPAYLSLEERMACGIGACLACVCHTEEVDAHTNTKRARICKEGPVFLAEEVAL